MAEILPVALIVTTKNEEPNVPEFLASLAAGSALPAEVIVCDAGSTDRTVALLREAAPPGVRVEVFVHDGATIAMGRNAAVRRATHEVLAVTDLGCRLHPAWLERIVAPLLADPSVDAVAGGYREAGRTRFERLAAASSIPVTRLDPAAFLPSSRSFAVRRASFEAAGMYPEQLSFAGEDTALCLSMRARGMRIVPRLDAEVTWYPRATLRAFIRQHVLYGVGDGEARQRGAFYARTAVKWSLLAAMCAAAAVPAAATGVWLLAVLSPLPVAAYFRLLAPKYGWDAQSPAVAFGAFGLVCVKEWALLWGWVRARLHPAPVRGGAA